MLLRPKMGADAAENTYKCGRDGSRAPKGKGIGLPPLSDVLFTSVYLRDPVMSLPRLN